MSVVRRTILLLATMVALVLPACGGGGQGLRVDANPLLVASTALPPLSSGQAINHVIPLEGGCGGPYVLQVVQGTMPDGVYLDADTHAIRGYLLEDGEFQFTVQVTDTGCSPFASAVAHFEMDVTIGDLTIVQALLDGVPSMIFPDDDGYSDNYGQRGPYPAIPAVVYGEFSTINLVAAGGVAPYEAVVYDDPTNPYDGALPTGAVIPESSTSITGAASEVGPEGGPFLVTVKVTDGVGSETLFTFYWLVRTPPIIIAVEDLADGTCGQPYSETMFIVDGVPPFRHELVAAGPAVGQVYVQTQAPDTTGDVVYGPPDPPTVPNADHLVKIDASWYPDPAESVGGTYDYRTGFVTPPEGLRLDEASGVLGGIPRRRGTFLVHYHVQSSLVPNNFGQHNWASFEFAFAPGTPLSQDPAYTVDGAFLPAPYALIPEAEKNKAYTPSGPQGLQLLAIGGVPKDGWTDAPHTSQATDIEGTGPGEEVVGAYDWAVDYDPDGDGGKDPIPGMELAGWMGVWRASPTDGTALVKQGPQEMAFRVMDQQLPTGDRQSASETVRFGVGPDTLVVTQSSTSSNHNSYYGGFSLNDPNCKIRIIETGASGVTSFRDLLPDDLTGDGANRQDLPATAGAGTTPAQLLAQVDITRVAVNPTGWWDDNHALNPRAARPMQHGDYSRYYPYYGMNYVYDYMNGSPWQGGLYQNFPDVTAVRLPKAQGITHDPGVGRYADGGKLYVFDSQDYFGVFIVRRDSRLYVPVAIKKGTYYSFGDNWTYDWTSNQGASNSTLNKIPQMSVTPDGRVAAMKLRTKSSLDQFEKADSTDVILFSLSGEGLWGGDVYKIVGSGASGTTSTGELLYASSLTLTNEYLYFIVGNGSSNGYAYSSWRDHFVYRYELLGGATKGALLAGFGGDNTSGSPLAMPFQKYDNTFERSDGNPDYDMIQMPGYNSWEGAQAPHPFRVSADGKSCVIVAGPTTGSTAGTDVFQYHVWIDSGGTLTRLSSNTRRILQGGGRGSTLMDGPQRDNMYHTGSWTGPSTQLEVSDDGSKVAVVYNGFTGTAYAYTVGSSYNHWSNHREEIAAFVKNGGSWSEVDVTQYFSGRGSSGAIKWRYGSLAFTKDGNGLVFWAGYPHNDPDTYTSSSSSWGYVRSYSYVGSIWGYDFTASSPGIYNLLSSSNGGATQTVGSRVTSYSPSESSWQRDAGVIKPAGGFYSMNREFFYVVTRGGLTSSSSSTKSSDHNVIGINVRSVNTGASKNGHTDFRAFLLGNMPSNRGFLVGQYYASAYGLGHYYYYDYYWFGGYAPGGYQGGGLQVASSDNGWVFFATHDQRYGPYSYASYFYGGPVNPTYYGDYGYQSGHVEVFDPNVGGDVQYLTASKWSRSTSSYPTYYRPITFIEVSDDGHQCAFIYKSQNYYSYDAERIGFVGDVRLDASTGKLVTTPFFELLTGSNARVAPTMSHHTLGGKVYVAYGSSNENNRTLYEFEPEPGTPGQKTLPGGPARFNILQAGR